MIRPSVVLRDYARRFWRGCRPGFGWRPDTRDRNDYLLLPSGAICSPEDGCAVDELDLGPPDQVLPLSASVLTGLAGSEFRIRDQGKLGSCTAFGQLYQFDAACYRATGSFVDLSPLALYKVTRELGNYSGDSGAEIRDVIKAMITNGAPWEQDWPYSDSINPVSKSYYDREIPIEKRLAGRCNVAVGPYCRLNGVAGDPDALVRLIKRCIYAGYAVNAGWYLYDMGDADGVFLTPKTNGKIIGGHDLCVYGYNDKKLARGREGFFWGPNSWSDIWGNQGWFFISYDHVRQGRARDFWVTKSYEWKEPV